MGVAVTLSKDILQLRHRAAILTAFITFTWRGVWVEARDVRQRWTHKLQLLKTKFDKKKKRKPLVPSLVSHAHAGVELGNNVFSQEESFDCTHRKQEGQNESSQTFFFVCWDCLGFHVNTLTFSHAAAFFWHCVRGSSMRGDTRGNCHKIYGRLSAASCKYRRLLFFKKNVFSLFSRLFLLQTTPPPSRPIQQPPVTKKEEVSVARETGEFIRIQSTGGWISSHCFTLSPLVRHLPVETSAPTSDGMFFCASVFMIWTEEQFNILFISPLQSVLTDGSAPSLVFAHFPS